MMQYVECTRDEYTLRGMMHVPDDASAEKKVPMVIILNGFRNDRCDGYFINVTLSRRLCAEGIANVRFDFMGSGESDGAFENMSILTETADVEAMLRFVQQLDFVDTDRIAIQGLSQGGMVSFLTAARHPDEIVCLSTWSPALVIHDACKNKDIGGLSLANIEEVGWVDLQGIKLGKQYYLDAINSNVYEEAPKFHGPVQIVHGKADALVPYQYSERMKDCLGDKCTLYLYEGMEHFNDSLAFNEIRYRHAIDFLKANLL